jgi:hypothetical protein
MDNHWRIDLPVREIPLVLPWPQPGNPGGFIQFDTSQEWCNFFGELSLVTAAPDIVRLKYERARKLHLLGWIDLDLIKAGELVALTALELALADRYGRHFPRKPSFHALLNFMVSSDGLTDSQIPLVVRCGGSAVAQLTGEVEPSLAQRRNAMAHGDPFDGQLTAGLLELVRDLIDYGYRQNVVGAPKPMAADAQR